MKLGSFLENWKAASRALSIKGAEGGSEETGAGTEDAESSSCGSGHGGSFGWFSGLTWGSPSSQGGALGDCDWALAGVVARASAKATTAPAMRSLRRVRRRPCPITDSPCLESSTIRWGCGAEWPGHWMVESESQKTDSTKIMPQEATKFRFPVWRRYRPVRTASDFAIRESCHGRRAD